jgi:hypothetical protein
VSRPANRSGRFGLQDLGHGTAGGDAGRESAARGPHGRWLVRYVVEGSQSVDNWFYLDHRWVFDIMLSNPGAAAEYRLPFGKYAATVGCHPQ